MKGIASPSWRERLRTVVVPFPTAGPRVVQITVLRPQHEIAGQKPDGARLERIRASPRWTGEQFRNLHPITAGLRDPNASMPTLHDFLCGGERCVPRGPLPSMNPLDAWAKAPASGLRATWLGHSTVLIEIDGLRVLTDPVWGPRASPSRLAGPKEPAHAERVEPWWRSVDTSETELEPPAPMNELPAAMSWPID